MIGELIQTNFLWEQDQTGKFLQCVKISHNLLTTEIEMLNQKGLILGTTVITPPTCTTENISDQ